MSEPILEAGAIAFRTDRGILEVLLIRSRKDPSKWVLPKGHMEPGETAAQTATRELCEEAGAVGEPVGSAGSFDFRLNQSDYHVAYFLHRFTGVAGSGEPGREPTWFPLQEALTKLSFENTRDLLRRSIPALEQFGG